MGIGQMYRFNALGKKRLSSQKIIIARGAEKLANPDLETWVSATNLGSWDEFPETGTINQESTTVQHGTYACRMDVAATGDPRISQTITSIANGNVVQISAWTFASAGSKANNLSLVTTPSWSQNKAVSTTAYAQQLFTFILTGADTSALFLIGNQSGLRSFSLYLDNLSIKLLTRASLFALESGVVAPAVTRAKCAVTAGTLAGVAVNVDSASNPQSFVLATHDGISTVRLHKYVAGVASSVLAVTVTYVAGADVEIRIPAAGTYQLFYNGVQRGADQTISDVEIASNTLHGIFNTWEANTVNNFFQVA